MKKIKTYSIFLEYYKEIETSAGKWRIKPKNVSKDNIDLDDEESTIKTDETYTFLGITFTPKYNEGTGSFFTLIQKKVPGEIDETYPSWAVYSDSIQGLKNSIRFRIKEYNEALEKGTIFDSIKFKNLNSYSLFLESNKIQNKLDELLDKISANGVNSLSSEERSLLDAQKGTEEDIEKAYQELINREERNKRKNYKSNNQQFEFDYIKTEAYPHENVKRHYGIMFLPNITLGDGTIIDGEIEGYIEEYNDGQVSTHFDKTEYTDFDFAEGLEYEYDDFIQEIIAYISEHK